MSIRAHRFSREQDYRHARFAFFKKVEGCVSRVYTDTEGIPTWGIGYALIIKKQGQWEVRPSWTEEVQAAGVDFSGVDLVGSQRTLEEVAALLNEEGSSGIGDSQKIISPWVAGESSEEKNRLGTPLLSDDQARRLFNTLIDYYQQILAKKAGVDVIASFESSKELTALLSLTYNSPTLIGSGLVRALRSGDRAEAWFQIRDYSNGKKIRGLAKRRFYEAHYFGLYNETSMSVAGQAVLAMYARRNSIIDPYESSLGSLVTDANRDYDLAEDPIPSMKQVLREARTKAGET